MAATPGTEPLLVLRDGRRVHVRPIRAEDEALLHEALGRMPSAGSTSATSHP